MKLSRCKLSVPAVGYRKLQLGHPIRMIVQDKMHQFIWEVAQDWMHHKQGWLRQLAGRCPGQILQCNAEIAPIGLAELSPSLDQTQ